MKAIVQHGYGAPQDVLRLADVEMPAVGAQDVLVAVRASSANPWDWHFIRGEPVLLRPAGLGVSASRSSWCRAGTGPERWRRLAVASRRSGRAMTSMAWATRARSSSWSNHPRQSHHPSNLTDPARPRADVPSLQTFPQTRAHDAPGTFRPGSRRTGAGGVSEHDDLHRIAVCPVRSLVRFTDRLRLVVAGYLACV